MAKTTQLIVAGFAAISMSNPKVRHFVLHLLAKGVKPLAILGVVVGLAAKFVKTSVPQEDQPKLQNQMKFEAGNGLGFDDKELDGKPMEVHTGEKRNLGLETEGPVAKDSSQTHQSACPPCLPTPPVAEMEGGAADAKAATTIPSHPFYANLQILNKEGVISKQVEEQGLGFLSGFATHLASAVVSEEDVAGGVADELAAVLSKEMLDTGVSCKVKKCFAKGQLVVMQVKIMDMDLEKLVKTNMGGDEAVVHLRNLFAALAHFKVDDAAKEVINEVYGAVVEEVKTAMATDVPKELAKEGVECKVDVKSQAEQAAWLFNYL